MTQLGRCIDPQSPEPIAPGIHALFVYNANPVVTTPHQRAIERGLARSDLFTVVHEQVMTDTARWADIVLPAATFLEGTDLKVSYGDYVAGGIRPVVEPVGEARTNMQLFAALGRRLGMIDEAFTWSDEELLRRATGALRLAGEAAEAAVGRGARQRYGFHGATPVQFETVAPQTADGRIHLTPDNLGPEPFVWQGVESSYPLALITPASARLVTSTLGESNLETLTVTLSPQDADRRGIMADSVVRVFNGLGEVHCRARVSTKVRPGVASMPKGAWQRSSRNGATSTALTPDDVQVVGGAACFNDARVEVELLAR
jgi:anaerobic selenocysteine-containing dehydrogenase